MNRRTSRGCDEVFSVGPIEWDHDLFRSRGSRGCAAETYHKWLISSARVGMTRSQWDLIAGLAIALNITSTYQLFAQNAFATTAECRRANSVSGVDLVSSSPMARSISLDASNPDDRSWPIL